MVTAAQAYETVALWTERPESFWRFVLGAEPYYRQLEMVDALQRYPRVAVAGANGTGKDWMTGRIMLWWQCTRYPAITVVIGPTHRQVADIVWKEAREAYRSARVHLGGRMYPTASRWEVNDRHYAVGFSTSDPWNLQGYHSPNLLVIVTEAHNVKQDHINAIKRLNPTRLLMTGNPLSAGGEFYEAFHGLADLYRPIEISAFDTPAFTAGRLVPGMVTPEQVEERKREWGEDSALYIAGVLGRFPDNLEDAVVPRSLLMAAVARDLEADGPAVLACDVARYGEDKTVVYRRQGPVCRMVWRVQGKDTQAVAGQLIRLTESDPAVQTIIIDDTGVGGGVTDRLREEQRASGRLKLVQIVAFNGGGRARDDRHYADAMTEAWMETARAFRTHDIAIDDNPALIGQLSSRRYMVLGSGKLKLESKDEYKARGKTSPDEADALAMCFALPPVTLQRLAALGERKLSAWRET